MNNMKISTRLAYAFGLILAVVIGSGLLALIDLAKVQGNLEDVVQDNNVKIRFDHEMSESVHIVSHVMRTVILLDDKTEKEAELAKINQARDHYSKAEKALEKFPASETGRANRDKIAAAAAIARPLNNQVIELAMANRDEEARSLMLKSASPAVGKWQEAIDENIAFQEKANQLQYEKSEVEYRQTQALLIGANILCLVLAVAAAWLVTRSITRQLGGEPSEAVQLAKSVAEGDLSSHIVLKPGDTQSMLFQLKAMQESLVKVVGTVRQGSESVSTASAEIAQGNQDLSARTESQASALEETAASMEELSSTVKQNADNARQANQLAQSASTVAVQGGEVVSQVVDTMKGINDSSKKIADIINVIDGIAFQTNILALNAAVEAARAGEQGRGFAVVAGEVRNLASRSAEAAKEIKTLITDSVSRVQQGSELADRAGSTMNEIVGSIKRVTDIMGEISAASTEQSQGVAQIGEAVQQMDQVTQQNAALVEEMAAAANSLKGQAQDLVQAVAVFKIDHGDALVNTHPGVAASQALTAAKTATRPAPRPTMTRPALTSHAESSRAPRATKATDAGAGDWENF